MMMKTMKYATPMKTLAALMLTLGLLNGCGSGAETRENPSQEKHAEAGAQHKGEGEEHAREVHLSPEQVRNLGIEVGRTTGGSANATIVRPAGIQYDLDRIAKIGPRIEAKVVKVLKDLGDTVQEGEPIALMSSVELGKAKAEYIRLRARLKAEEARYKREQSLYRQDISSRAELLEAEANHEEARAALDAASEALRLYGLSRAEVDRIEAGSDRPLSYFYLGSPMQGVVQERDLSPGQTVGPAETPIHVANLSRMWVMIDAYEQDLPYLEKGQEVSLTVRSIAGRSFKATTDWISYALQEDTRTMPVRAVIENPDGALRAGMFGTARIATGQDRRMTMVPVDAVQKVGDEEVVFVPGAEEGSFRAVDVQTGEENDGLVEVASGLQPGDRAVLAGAFDLKSALTAGSRSASHGH